MVVVAVVVVVVVVVVVEEIEGEGGGEEEGEGETGRSTCKCYQVCGCQGCDKGQLVRSAAGGTLFLRRGKVEDCVVAVHSIVENGAAAIRVICRHFTYGTRVRSCCCCRRRLCGGGRFWSCCGIKARCFGWFAIAVTWNRFNFLMSLFP